jgi:transcriptional regulator with XRE-family HTH domain
MTDQIRITSDVQAGRAVAKLRRDAGLRQVDLAKKLHVSTSTIHSRETGARGFTVGVLAKTLKRFGYQLTIVPIDTREAPDA